MRRDFTNILNLFYTFLWLNKTMSFFIENHETYPIGFAPFLKVNATTFNLYYHGRDSDYGHGYKERYILSPEVEQ